MIHHHISSEQYAKSRESREYINLINIGYSIQLQQIISNNVSNCNNLPGFAIHSVGGGTGSGLGALMLQRIAVNYREKSKVCTNLLDVIYIMHSKPPF